MNSISDFTRLRPDVDTPTPADLDALWARAAGTESDPLGMSSPAGSRRSRRWAATLGAAASVAIGVAALAFFAQTRSDEPVADAPVSSPATSIEGNSTTVPGATIPLTDLEAAAASLGIEVALESWTLDAEESVNPDGSPGGQWHYRSSTGQSLDIALYPGGEDGFLERIRRPEVPSASEIEFVGDFVRVATFAAPLGDVASHRLTGLLDLAGREFTVEVDLGPTDDEQLFYDLLATIDVVDDASGERVTVGDIVEGSLLATTAATGVVSANAVVVGDLVAIGAVEELRANDIVIDAVVGRQFTDGADVIDFMLEQQMVGSTVSEIDTVVVHLGSNGAIGSGDLDAALDAMNEVPKVVLVNSAIDREWVAQNNALLAAAAAERPNVELLDWATLAPACPGECFYDDGIHLTPAGAEYYAEVVAAAVDG
jgi:hypothetical protein